jgi:hypothetical protein
VSANPNHPNSLAAGGPGPARSGSPDSPVVMVSEPRSVLAANDLPAFAFLSIDASGLAALNCGLCTGRLPDFWEAVANTQAWGATHYGRTGNGDALPATAFDSVFGARGGYAGNTLLDVLRFTDDRRKNCLARHLVATVLNAAKGWTPPYVLDADLARTVWASFVTSGCYIPTENTVWYSDSSTPAGSGGITAWLKSTMS